MPEYEFTSDWFTVRIPVWDRCLLPLAGEPIHTLEIGSHEGRSALWVLEHVLTNPAATLTCVDVWADREVERRFDHNLATSAKSDQLVKRKGPSWRELRNLPPGQFAFVYIDGCHEGLNVLEDAVLSFRLLRPGGLPPCIREQRRPVCCIRPRDGRCRQTRGGTQFDRRPHSGIPGPIAERCLCLGDMPGCAGKNGS